MNTKKKIFIISMPIIMAICSLFLICDYVDAAPRAAVRGTPATARKSAVVKNTQQNITETVSEPVVEESEPEAEEVVIENKSDQFDVTVDSIMESATEDNSFAEMIRRQRAALEASESSSAIKSSMKSGKNSCDGALRTCMMKTCGNDFTKCATDGDTIFGDKLNKCRRDTECSGEEFKLFTAEIKADRDMNVKLSSYNNVINCGNSYNACIVNECGTTYTKCLGKAKADAAIQKCNTIAKECMEYDSGLASRIGVITGKLRENAEKDIKKDEERLYALRDKMKQTCASMGAMFDERTFDCVYTVNFFAGTNQNTPMASRKRYAGDTFICMQEWFGINATTYKENAYRETRAQTGASSAMLGSGVGTAVGLVTSGAIGRALDTQNAKKAVKEECEKSGGKYKGNKCVLPDGTEINATPKEEKPETPKDDNKKLITSTNNTGTNNDSNINSGNETVSFDSYVVDEKGDCWHIKEYGYPKNDTERKWRKPRNLSGGASIKIDGKRQKTRCDNLNEWEWAAQIDDNTKITGTSRCSYEGTQLIQCECQIKDSTSWTTVLFLPINSQTELHQASYCSGYCSAHCAANADILQK